MKHGLLNGGLAVSFLDTMVSVTAFGGIQTPGQNEQRGVRPEQSSEDVVLEVPASVKVLKVVGETVEIRKVSEAENDSEVKLINGAALAWSSGFRLKVSNHRLSL
jgi:hypothetical protein